MLNQAPGRQKWKATADGGEAGTAKEKPATKEGKGRRKAFITLSYIVVAYVACWVPFQFVFDVSLAKPEAVSADLYSAMFWLAYINSGLNPFMYAFSSADFRKVAVHIVKCRYCSQ